VPQIPSINSSHSVEKKLNPQIEKFPYLKNKQRNFLPFFQFSFFKTLKLKKISIKHATRHHTYAESNFPHIVDMLSWNFEGIRRKVDFVCGRV
jgi:hypothetical protein